TGVALVFNPLLPDCFMRDAKDACSGTNSATKIRSLPRSTVRRCIPSATVRTPDVDERCWSRLGLFITPSRTLIRTWIPSPSKSPNPVSFLQETVINNAANKHHTILFVNIVFIVFIFFVFFFSRLVEVYDNISLKIIFHPAFFNLIIRLLNGY